jgi:hypothetical protein
VPLAKRKHGGSDLAASGTSMKRESYLWLPPDTTGVRVPGRTADIADVELAMVAFSSEVVTA